LGNKGCVFRSSSGTKRRCCWIVFLVLFSIRLAEMRRRYKRERGEEKEKERVRGRGGS
jgi:hypothetical protein